MEDKDNGRLGLNNAQLSKRIKDLPFCVPDNIDPDAFLFLGDPDGKTKTLLGRWWLTASGALIAGGSRLWNNVLAKKPVHSGSHRTVLLILAGGILGEWLHQYKEKYCAERDLQMFHYVCLHPEDFSKPKRVLYRDYLTPWFPIR